MARPRILPAELLRDGQAILAKYGLEYDGHMFKKVKPLRPDAGWTWDRFWTFNFFAGSSRLSACCGVIEMQHCQVRPAHTLFPVDVTPEEWITLFKYHVRYTLHRATRRMALITLINSQRAFIPFAEAAGFEKVSEGYNPGTRHKVAVWALSI